MSILWVIMVIVAVFVGMGKNRPILGLVLGLLLGLIGVIIIACIPAKEHIKGYSSSDYIQGRDDGGILAKDSKPSETIFKE